MRPGRFGIYGSLVQENGMRIGTRHAASMPMAAQCAAWLVPHIGLGTQTRAAIPITKKREPAINEGSLYAFIGKILGDLRGALSVPLARMGDQFGTYQAMRRKRQCNMIFEARP